MFKIAICDDEEIFRRNIHKMIIDYMDKKGCLCEIDEFDSGKDFINLGINMTKYDIVFLDINMDDIDGIQTAEEIRKVSNDIFIVFVTAFIHYAVQGYNVEAIRYILKNDDSVKNKINYIKVAALYGHTILGFDFPSISLSPSGAISIGFSGNLSIDAIGGHKVKIGADSSIKDI